jgi:hypothetical protein
MRDNENDENPINFGASNISLIDDEERVYLSMDEAYWSNKSNDTSRSTWSYIIDFFKQTFQSGFPVIIFRILCIFVLAPLHIIISAICFFFVFTIPMAKLNYYCLHF